MARPNRWRASDTLALLLVASAVVYFSIDAWLGASGGVHIGPLARDTRVLEAEIQELSEQRDALHRKIDQLSGEEVDPELLDERLRRATGKIAPNDVILSGPDTDQ